MKQEKIFLKKKSKWLIKKKLIFSKPTILNIFHQNFRVWSLCVWDKLMRGASIWLNLYGCQAAQLKLKTF
jgi:hypothetical protein